MRHAAPIRNSSIFLPSLYKLQVAAGVSVGGEGLGVSLPCNMVSYLRAVLDVIALVPIIAVDRFALDARNQTDNRTTPISVEPSAVLLG